MNKPVITKLVFLCLGTLYWQAILADAALPRALEIITEGHELPSSSYSFLVQEIGGDKPLLCINRTQHVTRRRQLKSLLR